MNIYKVTTTDIEGPGVFRRFGEYNVAAKDAEQAIREAKEYFCGEVIERVDGVTFVCEVENVEDMPT